MSNINWIASRKYQIIPSDISNAPCADIFVAISMPRILSKKERPIGSSMANYGCTVQFGVDTNQRIVVGRDSFEAIFHGILAIEQYLIAKSKHENLVNTYGNSFDENIEGFLWGSIAREYTEHTKSNGQ